MIIAIVVIFILGYICITLEHTLHLNKAASALVTGVLCWAFYIVMSPATTDTHSILNQLEAHLSEIAAILFFLLGAMTIVELIDAHDGFELITQRITTTSYKKLLWITALLTFFLSAILDNLTTTIVLVSLLRKIIPDKDVRLKFTGITIIAANAGGAWSPIGDVSTTMLWIGGQVTANGIVQNLLLPSVVCLLVPLLFFSFTLKGNAERLPATDIGKSITNTTDRNVIFYCGIILLILVPVFKTLTHLPPFMGILCALGLLWIVSEILHSKKDQEDRHTLSVDYALKKIDTPSILFFLGILLAVGALQSTGILQSTAQWLDVHIKNTNTILITLGLLSSVVDNVPLVSAAMGMYNMHQFPTDSYFWQFLAYCAGTGGSTLIIGSAAGVAAMGMENIRFFWYLRKIAVWALIGYLAGAAVFIIMHG